MEKAIFVTILKNAKKLSSLKEYERLYLGNEFCENLIPSIKEVKETIKFCNENNLKFTFVTPYITNKSIELLKDIFIIISKEKPSSEIVINDYGILEIMKELNLMTSLKPVLGRLLVKMKTEPRIKMFLNNKRLMKHYRKSNIDSDALKSFLVSNKIYRVEFNNTIQGIGTNLSGSKIKGSIYYPYVYVTTTRRCVSNSADVISKKKKIGIYPCRKECKKYIIKMQSKMLPLEIIIKGNTEFYVNYNLQDDLKLLGINRVVYMPFIPV